MCLPVNFANFLRVAFYTHFFKRTGNILPASTLLFYSSIWASSVLIPVLIHSGSNKLQLVYFTITSHLACWKSRKFPISEGKKRNCALLLNIIFKKHLAAYSYTFLLLNEHNQSFTLFLICSHFFIQSELPCPNKVCSYKKVCI